MDRHFPALGCFAKLTEPVVAVAAIVSPEKVRAAAQVLLWALRARPAHSPDIPNPNPNPNSTPPPALLHLCRAAGRSRISGSWWRR